MKLRELVIILTFILVLTYPFLVDVFAESGEDGELLLEQETLMRILQQKSRMMQQTAKRPRSRMSARQGTPGLHPATESGSTISRGALPRTAI